MKNFIRYLRLLNIISKKFKIYDIENPDHYISGFEYDPETDKVYVNFEVEKKW